MIKVNGDLTLLFLHTKYCSWCFPSVSSAGPQSNSEADSNSIPTSAGENWVEERLWNLPGVTQLMRLRARSQAKGPCISRPWKIAPVNEVVCQRELKQLAECRRSNWLAPGTRSWVFRLQISSFSSASLCFLRLTKLTILPKPRPLQHYHSLADRMSGKALLWFVSLIPSGTVIVEDS